MSDGAVRLPSETKARRKAGLFVKKSGRPGGGRSFEYQ